MSDQRTIRIFISSPSDVRPERLKAAEIIARLDREFVYHFHVEAVLWEREPLVATRHFQDPDNIPEPRGMDIVVVILWSRLGLPLPADKFRGVLSGRYPVTGTEWEFEDALASARERGVPKLLLYRKTEELVSGLADRSALQQRLEQFDLVEDFFTRWFRGPDGQSLSAASHSFATTGEFEDQLYDHLHALLDRRVGAATPEVTIRWHEAPFRALLSYEYEHAPVFFGRTRARNELRELLARQIKRETAFVMVFGASGSGKSSLVKAGLLTDLALPGMVDRVALVRRSVMRPSDSGGDLLAALAAAILSPTALPELAGLHYTPERLATLLTKLPEEARLPIEQGLAEAGKRAGLTDIAEARLVIVVDQLEEIFTNEHIGHSDREAFVAALHMLAKGGPVWVIATMRSDFFDRLEKCLPLAVLSADARFLVLPPNPAEIGQIIRQPAMDAGLRFEFDKVRGIGLDEEIRRAATAEKWVSSPQDTPAAGTLPLLSFLLDQLWQRRSDTGLLTFAAYQELGGLEGAIGRRAEDVYQAQTEEVRKELTRLLRSLVTVEGGTATSRAAPLSLFPVGSPGRILVEAFLHPEARLLVAHTDSGQAQLRLSHEALLSHWSRARDQISTDARDLDLRNRLEQESGRWRSAVSRREKRGRTRPAGLPLAEARDLLARWGAELPHEVREFVIASYRVAWRHRLNLIAILMVAVISPALIVGVSWAGLVWWGVHEVDTEAQFVPIPGGCFNMGSPDSDAERYPNEDPVHSVCVKPFELGRFEVTQGEWRQVMVQNRDPSDFKGNLRRPVDSVSWSDVQLFVRLMSFFGRYQYRLPSESEWEYAARAGTTTSRYWGESIVDGCTYENIADQSLKMAQPDPSRVFAACNDGYGTTAPVGSYQPNKFGLYDMLGNVEKWVEDCYFDQYRDPPKDGSPVEGQDCTDRVIRGGSWTSDPRYVRSANRGGINPNARYNYVGFRVVRTAKR